MRAALLVLLALLAVACTAEIYFQENFQDGENWKSRWVVSDHKKDEGTAGAWDVTPGEVYGDAELDKGLHTTEDARFYAISAKTPTEFSTVGKTIVIQFSVKHQQGIDCGGGYLKLMPAGIDQTKFNGESAYNIMFGPDICGSTRRIHAIFNHAGTNKLMKDEVVCETDKLNHVYTLVVNGADLTYDILVDGVSKSKGKLEDKWAFLAPRQIKDPAVSKPADWVEEPTMVDPADVKPADWDSVPKTIPDPEATKPDDWDEELDGKWEHPQVRNPEWKGEWTPRRIPNPAYKGEWEHPLIDNPDYKPDPKIGQYESNNLVGIEIWQVRAGTVFGNFLVTDDVATATEQRDAILARAKIAREKYDEIDRAKKAALEAEAAADAAKRKVDPSEGGVEPELADFKPIQVDRHDAKDEL